MNMGAMRRFTRSAVVLAAVGLAGSGQAASPAEGHDIHIMAPHVLAGVVMGVLLYLRRLGAR